MTSPTKILTSNGIVSLTQYTYQCCVCDSTQPVFPANTKHPLGMLVCLDCRKPACSHCKFSGTCVKQVKHDKIRISADRDGRPKYGFVCCDCGTSHKAVPESKAVGLWRRLTKKSRRTAPLLWNTTLLDYTTQKCGECKTTCCSDCFRFKLLDGGELMMANCEARLAAHPLWHESRDSGDAFALDSPSSNAPSAEDPSTSDPQQISPADLIPPEYVWLSVSGREVRSKTRDVALNRVHRGLFKYADEFLPVFRVVKWTVPSTAPEERPISPKDMRPDCDGESENG